MQRTTPQIIIDLDGTLTVESDAPYEEKLPNQPVVETCRRYKSVGFSIVIFTARNMQSFDGDHRKITEHTLPIILNWLSKHDVPYDEVIIGKPWCGSAGFYVDDKAIRPDEFISKTFEEIKALVGAD